MKKNQQRFDAIDVMVLGAEMGAVYWVDCQAFTVMEHAQLKNAPDKILNLGEHIRRPMTCFSFRPLWYRVSYIRHLQVSKYVVFVIPSVRPQPKKRKNVVEFQNSTRKASVFVKIAKKFDYFNH